MHARFESLGFRKVYQVLELQHQAALTDCFGIRSSMTMCIKPIDADFCGCPKLVHCIAKPAAYQDSILSEELSSIAGIISPVHIHARRTHAAGQQAYYTSQLNLCQVCPTVASKRDIGAHRDVSGQLRKEWRRSSSSISNERGTVDFSKASTCCVSALMLAVTVMPQEHSPRFAVARIRYRTETLLTGVANLPQAHAGHDTRIIVSCSAPADHDTERSLAEGQCHRDSPSSFSKAKRAESFRGILASFGGNLGD